MSDKKDYNKYRFYGKLAFFLSKITNLTLRLKVYTDEEYIESKNYVFAFWHGKLFLPMVNMTKKGDKIANMVSPSKDGQIIATALESYGYDTVRGSSNKDNIKSLVQIIKKVKSGYSAGFAADGPKGPRFKIKPGLVYLAKKTGIEVVPLGGAFSRKWILDKAWDKFQFPKPFAKAVYIIGKPIFIPKDADVDEYMNIIDKSLINLDEKAEKIIKGENYE